MYFPQEVYLWLVTLKAIPNTGILHLIKEKSTKKAQFRFHPLLFPHSKTGMQSLR
jgi:hypothetical protein